MGLIEDANGRPMSEEGAPANGSNGSSEESTAPVDIRTVPTGTLIYNLVLVAGKEQGAYAMIQQMEALKAEQRIVTDPPRLTAMYVELRNLEEARWVMAKELNIRFRSNDLQLAAKRQLEMYEPGDLAEEPDV